MAYLGSVVVSLMHTFHRSPSHNLTCMCYANNGVVTLSFFFPTACPDDHFWSESKGPTAYISRISRGNTIDLSNSLPKFGSTVVLPAMLSSWICCQIVKDVLDIDYPTKHDISWVNSCLERPLLPM